MLLICLTEYSVKKLLTSIYYDDSRNNEIYQIW